MPTFEEFKVWIEIEGVAAQEYSEETKDGAGGQEAEKIVTCWIAVETGKVIRNTLACPLLIYL